MKNGQVQPPGGPGVPRLTGGGKADGKPNVGNLPGSSLDKVIAKTQGGKPGQGRIPSK